MAYYSRTGGSCQQSAFPCTGPNTSGAGDSALGLLAAAALLGAAAVLAGCMLDLPLESGEPATASPARTAQAPGGQSAAAAAFGTTTAALGSAAASPLLNQGGFPTWYSDVNGTVLKPCVDPLDPHCALLGVAGGFDISRPVLFPTNYPAEFFYASADSSPLATSECGNVGTLRVRISLTGAFANVTPRAGDQMVFGRVRVDGDGFCGSHTYLVKHPYGTTTVTTDARGRMRSTVDIGCFPTPGLPCDFTTALASPVISNGFLRWEPAVFPAAAPGYLGDLAGTPHRLTGGLNGFNGLTVSEVNGTQLYATDLFVVVGKRASLLTVSTSQLDVGQVVAGGSEVRTFTLTNNGPTAATLLAPSLSSVQGNWAVSTACNAAPLAPGASCSLQVTFVAGALPGVASGLLSVGAIGSASGLQVLLSGSTVAAGTVPTAGPRMPDLCAAGNLGRALIGSPRTQGLLVRNDGPGDYVYQGLSTAEQVVGSGDLAAFVVSTTCPVGGVLRSGQTCGASAVFTPSAHQAYAINLIARGAFGSLASTGTLSLLGRGGIAQSSARVDGINADGFPYWYQDDGDPANPAAAGVRVAQCLDSTDPYCVLAADAWYNPALPLAFPANYPSEAFYFYVRAPQLPVSDCGSAGTLDYYQALEQAFITVAPVAGNQMTFSRSRVSVTGGLCPGTTYRLVHPYGEALLDVDAVGGIKTRKGTSDVGCVPMPGIPCNFQMAVAPSLSDRYLRWDATAPAAPAGYLGDPRVLHPVTGSPFGTDSLTLINTSTGATVLTANQFFIAGKLAKGGLVASVASLDFGTVGTVAPGNTSQRSVSFSNPGAAATTLTGLAVTGTGFSVLQNNCTAPLAPGASCAMTLQLTASATPGLRSGTLTASSNASPVVVALTATVGNSAVAVVRPPSLSFGTVALNTTSVAQVLTLSNGGPNSSTYGMKLLTPAPGRTTAVGSYQVTVPTACGTAIFGASSCALSVTFKPTTAGTLTSTHSLVTDKGGTVKVTLTGVGLVVPSAILSPATASISGGKKVGSAVFTLTSTGSVAVVMGSPASSITGTNAANFTVTASTCPAAGGSLSAAATCKFTVSYVRAAGTATTVVHSATLTVNSTAGVKTVALSGIN